MAVIKTGEDYEKFLNIDRYMELIYISPSPSMAQLVEFLIQCFHNAFSDGKIKGRQLLDIGSGPTISSIISACNYVDEVYMSDYSKRHLDILAKWHAGKIEIQDRQVQRVCELEKKGQSVEERVKQMRQKVKQIVHIDILDPASLTGSDVPKQFDVITSCWCLDSVGQPIETYIKCAKNIYSLVKPGGYFVLFGNIDCPFYMLDEDKFALLNISATELRKIYEDVGFTILTLNETKLQEGSICKEGTGHFCMAAQKNA